jgi:hypothetical protein
MTTFPGPAHPIGPEDRIPDHPELDLFARVEGLAREEAYLLAIPERDRQQHHHDRLHAITTELDRVWEKLRERAEALKAHPRTM